MSVNITKIPVSAADIRYDASVPVPDWPEICPFSLYHCQENDPVPPVTVENNVADCPLLMLIEAG